MMRRCRDGAYNLSTSIAELGEFFPLQRLLDRLLCQTAGLQLDSHQLDRYISCVSGTRGLLVVQEVCSRRPVGVALGAPANGEFQGPLVLLWAIPHGRMHVLYRWAHGLHRWAHGLYHRWAGYTDLFLTSTGQAGPQLYRARHQSSFPSLNRLSCPRQSRHLLPSLPHSVSRPTPPRTRSRPRP